MVKSRDGIPPPPMPEGYRRTSVPSGAARLSALHERLEAFRNYMLGQTEEVWADENIDALLREVAAALHPPEGEVGALCERLEHVAANMAGEVEAIWNMGDAAADLRVALAHLRRLAGEREGGRREERERISGRLEEQAEVVPCEEDANVYRSAAMLVRADFSYDGAEEYEDALAAAERRLGQVEAALREIETLADNHRDGWLETRYTGGDQQYRLAIDEGLKWEAVGALARTLTKAEL